MLTQEEMYEKSFERPKKFFELPSKEQWEIDKELGILDWRGENLTKVQKERFKNYYKGKI